MALIFAVTTPGLVPWGGRRVGHLGADAKPFGPEPAIDTEIGADLRNQLGDRPIQPQIRHAGRIFGPVVEITEQPLGTALAGTLCRKPVLGLGARLGRAFRITPGIARRVGPWRRTMPRTNGAAPPRRRV